MLTIRLMENAECDAHSKLCSLCFHYPYFPSEEAPPPLDRLRPYGAFTEDGALTAGLVAHCFTASYSGQVAKLAGIGGVVSDPTHRKNGAIRQVFEHMLPDLYREGFVFSALYPFSHVFYRKFGYEFCMERRRTMIPTSDLPRAATGYSARLMQKGDDVKKMLDVYEKFRRGLDFAITRNEKYYEKQLEKDSYQTPHFVYFLTSEKGERGYVIGEAKQEEHGKAYVIEDMAYEGRSALMALLAFLRGFNEFECIKLEASEDQDWRMLVDEPYNIKDEGSSRGMLRVVNVEKALSLLAPLPFDAQAVVEITDGQIEENNGLFTVSSTGGRLTVQRGGDAPDLTLTIPALSQLMGGMTDYRSFLLCSKGVTVHKDNPALPYFFPRRRRHMNNYF